MQKRRIILTVAAAVLAGCARDLTDPSPPDVEAGVRASRDESALPPAMEVDGFTYYQNPEDGEWYPPLDNGPAARITNARATISPQAGNTEVWYQGSFDFFGNGAADDITFHVFNTTRPSVVYAGPDMRPDYGAEGDRPNAFVGKPFSSTFIVNQLPNCGWTATGSIEHRAWYESGWFWEEVVVGGSVGGNGPGVKFDLKFARRRSHVGQTSVYSRIDPYVVARCGKGAAGGGGGGGDGGEDSQPFCDDYWPAETEGGCVDLESQPDGGGYGGGGTTFGGGSQGPDGSGGDELDWSDLCWLFGLSAGDWDIYVDGFYVTTITCEGPQ